MKIHRIDKDGVGIWRFRSTIDREDAFTLLRFLRESGELDRGCFVLDFEDVDQLDPGAFQVLEDWFYGGAEICLSGLDERRLGPTSFTRENIFISVFPDWKSAWQYLVSERGRMGTHAAAGLIGHG